MLEILREEELKDEISHKLYFSLKKSGNNYPFFVKEKTVWEHIQKIVHVKDIERETVRRSLQLPLRRNTQQINKTPVNNVSSNTQNQTPQNNSGNKGKTNNAKRLLYQSSKILAIYSLLCVIATIILGFLQFEIGVVMSPMTVAILLLSFCLWLKIGISKNDRQ